MRRGMTVVVSLATACGPRLVVHHSTSSILGGVVATDAGVVFVVPIAMPSIS